MLDIHLLFVIHVADIPVVTCLFNLVYGVLHHFEVMIFYVIKSINCFLVSGGVIGPNF